MDLQAISEEHKREIQSKVSMDYIKSSDFMIFYSNALEELIKIKNVEKLKYFRSAIINGMIRQDIEENKKLLFIDALSNLPVDTLILLKQIADMGIRRRDTRYSFEAILNESKNDEHLLAAQLKALERYNLVVIIRATGMETYRHDLIIYGRFGKEFINFTTSYQ